MKRKIYRMDGSQTEVKEKLAKNVAGEEGMLAELLVRETDDAEEDGEDCETYELNGLATNGIDESNGDPLTWNGTGANDDEVPDRRVLEDMILVFATGVTNCSQDAGVVETETTEGDIEEEPLPAVSRSTFPCHHWL